MDAVDVKYTRALMLHATMCFWKRHFGLRGLGALGALWAGVALLWVVAAHDWYTIALSASAVLVTVLLIGVYLLHRHRALTHLARIEDGPMTFRFESEGLGISSNLGTSMLKWATFERLWKFSDVWLLFMSKQQYIVLPVDELRAEALELIDARVGGRG